jgi:sugar lactone lactonase YvrE
MKQVNRWVKMSLAGLVLALAGCDLFDKPPVLPRNIATLTLVAQTNQQWTGVAVSQQNRLFVNFPRWKPVIPMSVAEVIENNQLVPFPDAEWNTWNPSLPPQDHFVCVQSVYIDQQNFLWVLDPANPEMRGVVRGGPKLVKIDLATRQVVQKIFFDESVAFPASYLNDVRFDNDKQIAYITDSGRGAILVVDLTTGTSRRLLGNHFSTKSENRILVTEGIVVRSRDGSLANFHSDGIALTPQKDYIYYQAVNGYTLYRIATQWLLNPDLTEQQLNEKVEKVKVVGAHDGIAFGADGNLYLTGVERNNIERLVGNRLEHVVSSQELKWPDSFSVGPDGHIYVTTSQLHRNDAPEGPYKIFKFKVE